ncbi:sigma-70 family RNA polymerase sigma factor [Glacieibacterium sp.]|uniref:sigma-70 family RNA polymerase sigma factor n=1 Tax=Glacieibacterium sp. TaxID=2860237 RepID=UPI003B006216
MTEVWARLMIAAQAGDKAAYRLLLDEVQVWLTRYYRHRLPPDRVDDAVQDALVAVHTKRHTWDPSRPFGPWLAGVARYKWIDALRNLKATRTEELPETLGVGDSGDAVVSANVLARLMQSLKPAQADAIRLVKLEGRTVEETAALTGQSASLVKVNIHRGMARLMKLVEGSGDAG